MRLKAISLLLLAFLSLLVPGLHAQSGADPSDRFLNVYQLFQKGDSLSEKKEYSGAMQAYKEARQILEEIASKDPTWNPSIVDFRRKRIDEAIVRIQPKVGSGTPTASAPAPGLPSILPGDSLPVADDPEPLIPNMPKTSPPTTARSGRTPKTTSSGATDEGPLAQLTKQLESLKKQAEEAERDRDKARRERDDLDKKLTTTTSSRADLDKQIRILTLRSELAESELIKAKGKGTADTEMVKILQDQNAKIKKDLHALEIERDADALVRTQVGERLKSSLTREGQLQKDIAGNKKLTDDAKKAIDEANKKSEAAVVEANKKADAAVAALQKKMDEVMKERDTLAANLQKMTDERDAARTQVTQLKEANKNLDKLVTDNAALMAKLDVAEKKVTQLTADNAQKDVLIADLRKEVTDVKKQLDDVKKTSASYQKKMSELQASLDTTNEQLVMAKTNSAASAAEKTKMSAENELLRGIVNRQQKAQAGRDATTKLVLAEMAKMKIKSEDLISRIKFLGEPVVKLSSKEAALFKKPQVEVGDNEIALVSPKQGSEPSLELPSAEPAPAPAPVAEPAAVTPLAATPAPALALATATPAPLAHATPMPVATPAAVTAKVATPAPATPEPVKTAQASPAKSTRATPASIAAAAEQKTELPVSAPAKAETKEMASLDLSKVTSPVKQEPTKEPVLIEKSSPPSTMSKEARPESANTGGVTETGAGASTVPAELRPVATEAKEQFDRGNYREAEKLYEKILAQAPTNLYALSNLGVVRFREGKLKLAEEAFRKAIAIAPEDAFSRCTLGIIYYSQSRYDEAVNELTKSLAINPKYAAAHNFLGITASQKGWQEAAQKELETATALDPNYADAHFNLAVVYATQQPPNKESARQYYKKATGFGAEADTSLEALLK